MTEELNVQVSAPIIRVALYGEEDRELNWVDLDEHDEHNPATISDNDLIQLVANYLDMTVDELTETSFAPGSTGKLVASRVETGNITIRPETVLGNPVPVPALTIAFLAFIGALTTPMLISKITKLSQLGCPDNHQEAQLKAYKEELTSRGESLSQTPLVYSSNKGGAPMKDHGKI